MPTVIDRETVIRLLGEGAQLVDVLAPEDYADAHIAGAINIHLKTLNARSAGVLDRARPVITSCHDFQ
jgi:rhodanese-related sulfurtransferase